MGAHSGSSAGTPSRPVPDGRRATIRDVAGHAGVSKSLVSLAFRTPEAVSPERLGRIRDSARTLGFRPNRIARSMNGPGTDVVGILVADNRNPVFADVVDAARDVLHGRDRLALQTPATRGVGEGASEVDLAVVEMLADLRPSGVLVVGSVPDPALVVDRLGGPRVVFASARPDAVDGATVVRGDDRAGMRLLVDHLVERGHRRIAHVGGLGGPVSVARREDFHAELRERQLDPTLVAESDFSQERGERAAQLLLGLADPPTAIVAANDLAAIGALRAVRRLGLSGRVAVTGYDATYLSHLGPIDLTSVDPGSAEIGRRAAERVLDEDGATGEHLVSPTLVVRSSSSWSRTA